MAKTRYLVAALVVLAALAVVGVAYAFYGVSATPDSAGGARATAVTAGQTPTASVDGQDVTVSWPISALYNGAPVDGYLVSRYDAVSDEQQTITGDCTGTIATSACTEHSVPGGDWRYTVTPLVGNDWRGAESAKSATVTVLSPPSMESAPAIFDSARPLSQLQEGDSLMTTAGEWTNSPDSYAYQWQSCDAASDNCADIAGATGRTYALGGEDVGTTLQVEVTAANDAGATTADSSVTEVVALLPPENGALPAISGNFQQGQTLIGDDGIWTSSADLSYARQWRRCDAAGDGCADILTVTGKDYTLTADDVGATLRLRVTATNAAGSTSASSEASAVIIALPPEPLSAPEISGEAAEGQTLTAATGEWSNSPTSYSYQWQRSKDGGTNWSSIAAAEGKDYTLGAADADQQIRVQVKAANSGGATPDASAPITVVALAPTNLTAPTIWGLAQLGNALIAVDGDWQSSVAIDYSYQWRRCDSSGEGCVDIVGETSATYAVSADDIGQSLRVVVSAANSGGATPATSEAISFVLPSAPANATSPTVAGDAVNGQTLTAATGDWSNSPTSYSYQWRRCDTSGDSCADVVGAAIASYVLASADIGHTLRAIVTATNDGGSASAASVPSSVVADLAPAPSLSYFDAVSIDEPVGYWRLGESSSTAITDALSQGHDGVYRGTVVPVANGTTTGNGAQAFDGGWGAVDYYPALNPAVGQGLTMEFWYKAATAPASFLLVKGYTSHVDPYYQYGVGSLAGQIRVVIDTSGSFTPWDTGVAWPTDDVWHYYAVTYDRSSDKINLYVDATLQASVERSGDVRGYISPLGLMDVLNLGPGFNSTGELDEVAIYTAALSSNRLAAHYAAEDADIPALVAAAGTW